MSLKNKSKQAFKWAFLQQIAIVILNLTVSILMARILSPKDFGLIGMIAVFIAVGRVLMSGGLGASIIRTKQPSHRELSTVFVTNLCFSLFFYIVIYFLAPFIATFFEKLVLVKIIRIYSLVIIIFSFTAVQLAKLTQELNFKLAMKLKIPSIILGGIVGISMGKTGFGVWSLIAMYLIQAFSDSILLWYFSGWRPSFKFCTKDFKKHFNFGVNITLVGVLNSLFDNIYNIVIGRYFSPVQLGYYTRSLTLSQIPVYNLQEVITKVSYPILSKIQDQDERVKMTYRKITQVTMLVIYPILAMGLILATPLFRFFLTEKWLPAVPYFQLLCVAGLFLPLIKNNINILMVKGNSKLILRLGVLEKIIISLGVLFIYEFGIFYLMYFQIFSAGCFFLLYAKYCGNAIKYGVILQFNDFFKIVLITSLTGVIGYYACRYISGKYNDLLVILLITFLYIGLYLLFTFLFLKGTFKEVKNLIFKSNGFR